MHHIYYTSYNNIFYYWHTLKGRSGIYNGTARISNLHSHGKVKNLVGSKMYLKGYIKAGSAQEIFDDDVA